MIMLKRTLLLAVAPAMLVAGCSGTKNRGLESVHQPVVSRADYAFDVGAGPGGLAPGENQRLAGWMGSLRVGYGDRIAVDDPSRDPGTRADVAATAARYGLLVSDDAPVTAAPIAPGTVRVVVSRAKASVPGCPDYSRMQPSYDAQTSSNHGCSINSNLATMVASPTDLVRGEGNVGVYDPAVGTRAINSFRKAEPTGAGGTAVKAESAGGK
ncbi:CpaD family pilus assembly lipoprotein [Sphingomonas radiodurans]|uniref:CpaD family pilus assembly lipoprotein n=1 Tax=Sphingomonas radiodurans TaxID=2890321 RepID=UPI001E2B62E9|nr:CpaD family pilus assembly lipoprotein [Sphingomonas radiodurans]WBH16773.1 CpaD family pilus assembly lipoprotein [Sphingomonas radiodurans]